jgi:hypothetical protein
MTYKHILVAVLLIGFLGGCSKKTVTTIKPYETQTKMQKAL